MAMKKTLNGFNVKLKSPSEVGILGDSRQWNKAGGHAEELRGRGTLMPFPAVNTGGTGQLSLSLTLEASSVSQQ